MSVNPLRYSTDHKALIAQARKQGKTTREIVVILTRGWLTLTCARQPINGPDRWGSARLNLCGWLVAVLERIGEILERSPFDGWQPPLGALEFARGHGKLRGEQFV